MGAGPILGVADRPGFNGVCDEVAERFDGRLGRQERMLPRAPFVEDLAGPAAKGLGGERQQPMELLKEPRQYPAHVRDHFVRMGAHQTAGMHDDAEALCSEAQAIPVASLELTSLVGIEEEVTSGGPPREGPRRAGLDDASSRHARGRSEKHAYRSRSDSCVIAVEETAVGWRFTSPRRRPPPHNNTKESLVPCLVCGNVGRIFSTGASDPAVDRS